MLVGPWLGQMVLAVETVAVVLGHTLLAPEWIAPGAHWNLVPMQSPMLHAHGRSQAGGWMRQVGSRCSKCRWALLEQG